MRLTAHERERLLITPAADVAERRRGRGLKLNHPETVAVLTSFVLEGARDGRTVAADPGALIVRRDSQVDVRLELTLGAGAAVDWRELVVLGRPGRVGHWSARP
jgi:urease subunit gamma